MTSECEQFIYNNYKTMTRRELLDEIHLSFDGESNLTFQALKSYMFRRGLTLPEYYTRKCKQCGSTFLTKSNCAPGIYCPDCKEVRQKQQIREWSKRKAEKNRIVRETRNRRVMSKMSLAKLNELARKEHMSYGYFVAMKGI